MRMSFRWSLSSLFLLLALTPVLAQKPVVLGLLRGDAEKHNVEFQQYDRMVPVYKESNIAPTLVEIHLLFTGAKSADQIYQLLKPYHAVVLATTTEGDVTVHVTPELQAYAKMVGEGLARYVREGGGLFVQMQSVRYPNTDDEKYWNIVLEPFGVQLLHEGCFDPTRTYKGFDLGPTTYWFTQNIKTHPITQGIQRLYLPLYGPGRWPGIPALKYSPEWEVVVSGEKDAKSLKSTEENELTLDQQGTYTSEPPVVAVRQYGKGRLVSFPLSPIHSGMNYNNPLWKNTAETTGDKGAGLPSFGLKLLMNCYRWAGEPATNLPEFGTYKSKPYATVKYPEKVDWDKVKFNLPNGGIKDFTYPDGQKPDFLPATDGIRGIVGMHTAYTDGKGTVADYVKAAKAIGLSFIVFNDPLELLTKEKLEQLKQDCLAASGADFYACPGIEFTDGIGNRWAFWGEKVVFPGDSLSSYGKVYKPLWDGKRILHFGAYIAACAYCPSALLDYQQLAANGAHRENLWWFFDYLPFVYEKDKLIADNYGEYLYGLRDLRWSALASFTRVSDPGDVLAAAKTCVTGFKDLASAREGLNTRCGGYFAAYTGRQYVSQGPTIATWDAINPQMEHNWQQTRGAQRVRLKFIVRSPIGIAEVKVHDADTSVVRRFLGHGEKELSREFEVVDDQQHYLTLEVTDTAGKRAISWYILVYSYKQGLFRCADNLNILGATGLIWHPDRNEMMPATKQWENGMDFGISGWDAGGYLCPMPVVWSIDKMQTDKGWYPEFRKDGIPGKILDMALSSYNIQIATQKMTMLSEPYDTEARPTPALATVPKDLKPIDFFQRTHTIYAPMTRTDWYTAWNYRRPREGAKDYRGGLMWHEGEIRFTKDVTLKGKVPISLLQMKCPTDLEKGWGTTVIVNEGNGKTRVGVLRDAKSTVILNGSLHAGGYVSQMPSLVGYNGFLAPAGYEYSYEVSVSGNPQGPGAIQIGLGRDGQQVKAGTVMRYKYAVGTFADAKAGNALLEDTAAALNMAGGQAGYPFTMQAGNFVDGTFFFTTRAVKNESAFSLGKRDLIIDLPLRVEGLVDNGCAAVYTKNRPWFRFVPVVNGTAYFQESTQAANELWVGNIFVCDNKAVRLAVVVDGQADGKKPFLEAHNPTDKPITATITSPKHTPLLGGISARVTIPAGDSIRLEVEGKTLVVVSGQ
ncbi:MAG: CehA/McbA family metallohydrolase domain-containing protein [Armatimonadota bacterium]